MDKYKKIHDVVCGLWPKLTVDQKDDNGTLIGLPSPYVIPSTHEVEGFVYTEQYYWDTYFTVRGLIADGEPKLAVGMVDNLLFLVNKYGMVPNASRLYMMSRSQPPFLHMMVVFLAKGGHVDDTWTARAYKLLELEYANVWMNDLHPHNRRTENGLSRYYDINVVDALAEAESGWDSTDRFYGKCLDYTPVDLNCYMALFEHNMAFLSKELGLEDGQWVSRAAARKIKIKQFMYSSADGWFYDYNYRSKQKSDVPSLAGAMTLLVPGLLTTEEAAVLVKKIETDFEADGGLRTSLTNPGSPNQWAGTNGWAPLHILVVDGLRLHGYETQAKRIAGKWLDTVNSGFMLSGELHEKYNVVHKAGPVIEGLYPTQVGFAWTNASVSVFIKDFS